MAKRKKTITAGRLVLVTMASMPLPRDPDHVRAEKSRCMTAARAKLNLKQSCQKLELLLAANFDSRDYYITLTYDDTHLPSSRPAAKKIIQKYIKQLRAHRRARNQDLKYIYVTEGLHGSKRLHHHIVVNGYDDIDDIQSLWTYGAIKSMHIDLRQVADLARYLTKEPRDGIPQNGKRCWTPSLNLVKPATQSEIVSDDLCLMAPKGAIILEREEKQTEFGEYVYIKYFVPDPAPRPLHRAHRKTK